MPSSDENDTPEHHEEVGEGSSKAMTALKLLAASVFVLSAISTFTSNSRSEPSIHRRLSQVSVGDTVPSYMGALMKELKERRKLMEETPPEEVKYWFEYTGPLQVSACLAVILRLNL